MNFGKLLKSCCFCKHHRAEQRLTQDRLDVDIYHFCLKRDDDLWEDFGEKEDCKDFEEKPELNDPGRGGIKFQNGLWIG